MRTFICSAVITAGVHQLRGEPFSDTGLYIISAILGTGLVLAFCQDWRELRK